MSFCRRRRCPIDRYTVYLLHRWIAINHCIGSRLNECTLLATAEETICCWLRDNWPWLDRWNGRTDRWMDWYLVLPNLEAHVDRLVVCWEFLHQIITDENILSFLNFSLLPQIICYFIIFRDPPSSFLFIYSAETLLICRNIFIDRFAVILIVLN